MGLPGLHMLQLSQIETSHKRGLPAHSESPNLTINSELNFPILINLCPRLFHPQPSLANCLEMSLPYSAISIYVLYVILAATLGANYEIQRGSLRNSTVGRVLDLHMWFQPRFDS